MVGSSVSLSALVLSLSPFDQMTFRKLMKKFKSKRAFGVDQIDSYSLKLAAPLIEDALIHFYSKSFDSFLQVRQSLETSAYLSPS